MSKLQKATKKIARQEIAKKLQETFPELTQKAGKNKRAIKKATKVLASVIKLESPVVSQPKKLPLQKNAPAAEAAPKN